MSDENHSLEELRQKAEFLRKEKQRIIKTQREKDAIQKLQREIEGLKNPLKAISTREELVDASKKRIKEGVKLLNKAHKQLLSKHDVQEKSPIEKDLEQAQRTGIWPSEITTQSQIVNSKPQSDLESKWQAEKQRLHEEKKTKSANAKILAEKAKQKEKEGCLMLTGVLAFFIPIFWPIAIIQLFETHPKTCYMLLGVFAFMCVIIFASAR